MSKRLIMATLGSCLAVAAHATTAEARLHSGIIPSYYDQADPDVYRSKPSRAENRKALSGKRHAKRTLRKSRKQARTRTPERTRTASLRARAVTASHSGGGGGGASRSCLQPQARALLNRIESQFGTVQVISTCRPGAVVAGTGRPSKHRYGLAIDFNAGSRKGAIVQWLIANHHSGGTMTYRAMNHIHVDIGPRFVSLGASGRGGRRARS